MPKLALFITAFFLLILFQQSAYGFIEGDEVPTLSNFDIERTSDIISVDLPRQEILEKRYLIYGSGSLNNVYSDKKNIVYGINSDKGFFSVGILTENEASKLKSKGYNVIEDFALDFHSKYVSTNAITKISQFGNFANSEQVHKLYNVTGKGVTVAVMDTGVDFSNPDIMESVARDDDNNPIMLDADGQGLVLTNSTFAANIKYGKVYNFTKGVTLPENATSNVYQSRDGVFLNTQSVNGTVSIYNSLYPYYGVNHILNAKVAEDMKIGTSEKNFIPSKSGIYHLGVIIAAHVGKFQAVIVLVTDPNEAGVYDTITPDMSTSWMDFTREENSTPDYDFDFTDEMAITIGSGNEFLIYDSDDDGTNDYSAGTVGARVVDIHGIFSDSAEIDDRLGAINGTLLPAMDKSGNYFGVMNDFFGHGTASSATIVSKGKLTYDIYNDTKKSTILGIAPDASILPVKSLWFGDVFYGWMWVAGFENEGNKWIYADEPKADIISNSWGVSNFPNLEYAPGLDISSHILNALVIPQSLHQNYTGTTIISSAGNSGHGYGTMGMPGISSFGISVGAVTSNDFVGYGPFKGEPRFGNTTDHSDHVVDFSSRGPGVIGDIKPDLMSIGAYGFVPSAITKLPDEPSESFSVFGGTSMAAPIAAGSAALVVESLKEKSMSYDPFTIRNLLMSSASDLRSDPLTQGAGLVNALDAVRIVNGHGGKFMVHNDASFSNIKEVIGDAWSSLDSDSLGIDSEFNHDETALPMTGWYGGRLNPGEETITTYTIENPNNYPIDVTIKPQTLKLIDRLEMSGITEPLLQDPILNEDETYRPNYIKISDIAAEHRIANETSIIHPESSLMILNAHFPFDVFMNQTDTDYADELQISSLYVYDWDDKNTDDEISSDELSMVNRGGSWGTVQEIRLSDPVEKFENEPIIGVYPVPQKFSFWKGNTNQNATAMDYALSISYYQNVLWDEITVDKEIMVPPNSSSSVRVTLSVPLDSHTGVYQGFLNFEGKYHEINSPVSYGVLETVEKDVMQTIILGSPGDILYGNGYVKGAFDMTSRYMAGDWRQYYFDIQDNTINSATINFEWENDYTNFTAFMIDPQGKIIQTNFPSGVFGEFLNWPTGDWLGTSAFSGGGTFYPLKNKDNTSTVLFAPINQTGTYTLLVHSTLFDGTEITEPVSLAAKFTTIVPDDKPPEITFEVPELINKKFDILPEIIEKNPDFVKYYLDGEEHELEKLQFGVLPDGEHDLRIHASDIVGNDIDKTFSFTVDNTPPEILIKSPINGTTVSHSLNIDFKVKDENLADDGSITILLPNGESLDDITFHSFNVTGARKNGEDKGFNAGCHLTWFGYPTDIGNIFMTSIKPLSSPFFVRRFNHDSMSGDIDSGFGNEEVVLLDFSDKNIYEEMMRQEQKRKEEMKKREAANGGPVKGRQPFRPQHRRTLKRGGKRKKYIKEENTDIVTSVEIPENVRVYEFAEQVNRKVGEVVGVLFALGMMVTKNDFLSKDEIEILADEFEVEVTTVNPLDELDYSDAYDAIEEADGNLVERPPVITIMGHVDHGKTSLLDKIRSAKVADREAGGITQHVGAYQVEKNGKKITFVDTPGHEAFTAMRARGAQATDIVIIVVAADDGVMPQTKEAIAHTKAAGVPLIVAINKMDKESANPDNVKSQLAELDVMAADWGGEYEFVPVSAHSGLGIDELLETILLQAEVMELTANPAREAKAAVVEASLEKGFGPVANVIIQNGTLKVGDNVIAGTTYGRIKAIKLDDGTSVKEVGPSTPAAIVGLNNVPAAGDELVAMATDREVRELADKRAEFARSKELSKSTKATLDDLSALIAEGQLKSLPVIIKADVQGSLEAIKGSLEKLRNEEVKVNIIHEGVGGVTESDLTLADASEHAVVLGFNVRPTGSVKKKAKELGIEIHTYTIIYDLLDSVKALLGGMMSPVISEEVTGQAEVRETFVVGKVGTIAGCKVSDGSIFRNSKARLIRDGVVVYESTISSLKRFNEDAKEVKNGYECGIMLENFNDIKAGDVIETFKDVEEQVTL